MAEDASSAGAARKARSHRRSSIARWLLWAFLGITFAVAVLPSAGVAAGSDKAQHFLAFLVITLLAQAAYPALSDQRLGVFLGFYGALIELGQAVSMTGRRAELADWAADCLGIVIGLVVRRFLRRGTRG